MLWHYCSHSLVQVSCFTQHIACTEAVPFFVSTETDKLLDESLYPLLPYSDTPYRSCRQLFNVSNDITMTYWYKKPITSLAFIGKVMDTQEIYC